MTKNNVKSCMNCSRPHRREAYENIIEVLRGDNNV